MHQKITSTSLPASPLHPAVTGERGAEGSQSSRSDPGRPTRMEGSPIPLSPRASPQAPSTVAAGAGQGSVRPRESVLARQQEAEASGSGQTPARTGSSGASTSTQAQPAGGDGGTIRRTVAEQIGASLTSTLQNIVQNIDARRMLLRANDGEFLQGMRDTALAQIEPMRDGVAELKSSLREIQSQGSDAAQHNEVVAHYEQRLNQLDSVLRGLEQDKPWATRAAIYGAMTVALPALPMAVASQAGQNKFMAELSGMYAKTALLAVGAARSPTGADSNMVREHFMERHFLTLLQTAMFAVPTFTPQLRQLNDNAIYNVAAAALTTLAAVGAFFHRDIKDALNTKTAGSLNPGLKKAWDHLQPATRDGLQRVLAEIKDTADINKANLAADRAAFERDGKSLSPSTATQVNLVADALVRIGVEVKDLLGAQPVDAEAQRQPAAEASNPHLRAKMALALLNVALTSTVAALMVPDWIGVGGNAGDALFTGAIGLQKALSPHVTQQDALDSFRSWSGLSLIMVGLLAANKAAGDFMENGGAAGAAAGALGLALLNVTLPGPLGNLLGKGMEKLLSLKPQDLLAVATSVGGAAENLFRARAEQNPPSSVRIEEVPPDTQLSTAPRPA